MNNAQRYFSIVMPLYNKEQYIVNTIKSVLDQTYCNFELIIVDDGSTDNSACLVENVNDKRIKLIQQKNAGETAARNTALKAASHEYIAFLDSDDLWLPDFLYTMNELIDQYPGAGAYGCSYVHVAIDGETLNQVNQMEKNNENYLVTDYFTFHAEHEQTLTASSTVINRRVIDKVGMFTPGLRNWGDIDFWTRIGLYFDVAFTERVCTVYNDVATGTSKVLRNLHAPVFDDFKKYLKDSEISEERKQSFVEYVIRFKFFGIYQQYLADGKRFAALRTVLPYYYTKTMKKQYVSLVLQFILTPELFFKINDRIKGRKQ